MLKQAYEQGFAAGLTKFAIAMPSSAAVGSSMAMPVPGAKALMAGIGGLGAGAALAPGALAGSLSADEDHRFLGAGLGAAGGLAGALGGAYAGNRIGGLPGMLAGTALGGLGGGALGGALTR